MTAFSATFKFKFLISFHFCTNMSKNAFYLPVRCRVFTLCKTAPTSAALDFSTTKLGRIIQGWKIVESEWTPRNKKWTPGNKKWTPKRQKWSRNHKKWSRDHKKVDTKRVQKWTQKKEAYPSFEKYTSLYIYRKKPYANLLIYVLKAVTSSRWRF